MCHASANKVSEPVLRAVSFYTKRGLRMGSVNEDILKLQNCNVLLPGPLSHSEIKLCYHSCFESTKSQVQK